MNIEDYKQYYINGSDHFLIPRDVFEKLMYEFEKNKQLKDNWNKLKEMLPNVSKHYKNQFQLFSANCCEHILEIMQELENGDSNE